MPFIHIKSLPYETPFDVPTVITGICRDFAQANDIPLEHVHATWAFFAPGHFAKGGSAPRFQPESLHPILVDLLTPDFNSMQTVQKMLRTLAGSISTRAKVSMRKIFINHRPAHSDMVFDNGEVVTW